MKIYNIQPSILALFIYKEGELGCKNIEKIFDKNINMLNENVPKKSYGWRGGR